MFQAFRPAFTAASPALTELGNAALGYGVSAVGFVGYSTAVYLTGAHTSRLATLAMRKLRERMMAFEKVLEAEGNNFNSKAAMDKAVKAAHRRRAATEAEIEAEISRRIDEGLLTPTKPPFKSDKTD